MNSRRQFLDLLESQLIADDNNLALIIVKVCRFREVNITYGLKRGDDLIRYVESSIRNILRPVDQLGRIGDTEFAIILPALNNASHALLAANKISSVLEHTVDIDDIKISPTIAMGIAASPEHGDNMNSLMHAALMAVQQAEQNNESYLLHTLRKDEMPSGLLLENDIQTALDSDELSLYCQPKIDLSTRTIQGGESLIRWFSPKYGQVDTQYFIAVLEGSRTLMPVTNWVINAALRQCLDYQGQLPDFRIAVNLSPSLLTNQSIIDVINNAVSIWSLDPGSLILEVTEGAMMVNPKQSLKILNELHQAGYGIAIDDFGTGYSSLAYLKNLPADEIKIDKSFVENMSTDSKDASIVKAAIELSHTLGLKVVAEGVEDQATMDMLTELGCDYAQGFYLAMPMSFEEFVEWIRSCEWL